MARHAAASRRGQRFGRAVESVADRVVMGAGKPSREKARGTGENINIFAVLMPNLRA
jgi:hypothetical protein